MKIVGCPNTHGASLYVSVHTDSDTEICLYSPEAQASVLKIGTVTIFASDADLTILASAIGDHILKKNL